MPTVEVKARRVGGSTFQIPTEVQPRRRMAVGMKWMIGYARKRNEKSMAEKLAGEILAAARNEGSAVKKKRIHTKWQKPTRRLRTLEFNKREIQACHAIYR